MSRELTDTGFAIVCYIRRNGLAAPVRFGPVAASLGTNMLPRFLGAPLGHIGRVCQCLGLPRIDAWVVGEDDLPGRGFCDNRAQLTHEEHRRYLDDIEAYGLDKLCETLLATRPDLDCAEIRR